MTPPSAWSPLRRPLDAALGLRDAGPVRGLAALLAGVIGAAVQLASRKAPAVQKAN